MSCSHPFITILSTSLWLISSPTYLAVLRRPLGCSHISKAGLGAWAERPFLDRRSPPHGRRIFCAGADTISYDYDLKFVPDLGPETSGFYNIPATDSATDFPTGFPTRFLSEAQILNFNFPLSDITAAVFNPTLVPNSQSELVSAYHPQFTLPSFSVDPEVYPGLYHSAQLLTGEFQVPQASFGCASQIQTISNVQDPVLSGQGQSYISDPNSQVLDTIVSLEDIKSGVSERDVSEIHSGSLDRIASSVIDPATTSPISSSSQIPCTWPSCNKTFSTTTEYNHHSKNHSRPFICTFCTARHATKRQRDRHINEVHNTTERYYCTVSTCKRSLEQNGKPFLRDDGCMNHMRRVHGMGNEEVKKVGMDEETKIIRSGRKALRRVGG